MITFDMVAACDHERGIGRDGELPWKLPGDTAFFKRITTETQSDDAENAVIMGRKTWESIPARFRPLDDRLNVVVTHKRDYEVPEGVMRAGSIAEALQRIAKLGAGIERVFVIGGGEIYHHGITMPECRRLYVTRVEGEYGCDAFFPAIGKSFALIQESERHEENGIGYTFQIWERASD
jgi:dihydrofolate reductase / thymidylate synthase